MPSNSTPQCQQTGTTSRANQRGYSLWIWRVITLGLLLTCAPLPALAQFAGGNGSRDNPWLIATAQQLSAVRQHLDGHFELITNLDLGGNNPQGTFWNGGEGWEPLGNSPPFGAPFSGTFDGNGHRITNLYINRPLVSYVGLFGSLDRATLDDISLCELDITGDSWVGGLAGNNSGAAIRNAYAAGSIHGNNYNVGGLVGSNYGTVLNSAAQAQVSARGSVGALAGVNYLIISNSEAHGSVVGGASDSSIGGLTGANYGSIERSFSTAAVDGGFSVGGLVGFNNSTIAESYARGAVDGINSVGGLVGYNTGMLTNTYSMGAVTGDMGVGGLIGESDADSAVSESFWDITTSGRNSSAGGIGLNTAQMQNAATYTAWNSISIWTLAANRYPTLQVPGSFAGGQGSLDSPWQIATAQQLNIMRHYLNRHYVLVADIDLGGSNPQGPFWNGGFGWQPIGDSFEQPFTGSLQGNGHVISNLHINQPEAENSAGQFTGLFGYIEGAGLRDFQLTNMMVTGKRLVGGLVGLNGGTIVDVSVQGQVSGVGSIGSLAGVSNGIIINSSGSGTVTGQDSVGGLVGQNGGSINGGSSSVTVIGTENTGGLVGINGGVLRNGRALGAVNATERVGGLAGTNQSRILDSYARGSVAGQQRVGGLAGINSGTIVNSYQTEGAISGQQQVGGLVGSAEGNNAVLDSYWNQQTSGLGTSAGGTASTTAQMQTAAPYAIWNSIDIWTLQPGTYPTLRPVVTFNGGAGFADNPWQISSARELNEIREYLDKHFVLVADIDLGGKNSSGPFWHGGLGWEPIGASYPVFFTGSLEGDSHRITGLYINRPQTLDPVGLFGRLEGGWLDSIDLHDVEITGSTTSMTGALAGFNAGSISRSSATGVLRNGDSVGGLVGHNLGTITSSSAAADVAGGFSAGGLAGSSTGTIIDSNASGMVEANSSAGGLAGFSSGIIRSSSAGGTVHSKGDYGGGLVGLSSGTIESSSATANVTGPRFVASLVAYSFGNVFGDPANPVLLENTRIANRASINHVIIGAGTVLASDVTLGANVRFTANDLVTPGLELTPLFDSVTWPADESLQGLGLNRDVLVNASPTVLHGIRALNAYQPPGSITQDPVTAELRLETAGVFGTLLPLRVFQAAANQPPGTFTTDDGDLLFVTATGRAVVARALVADLPFLKSAAMTRELEVDAENGNVVVLSQQENMYFSSRAFASIVGDTSQQEGLRGAPSLELPNVIDYSIFYRDDDDVLMQQSLLPRPADWLALKQALLALPGMQHVGIDAQGRISAVLQGRLIRGRTAYVVTRGHSTGLNIVTLQAAQDLNGDGTNDFVLIYPNGNTQLLYIYR